MSPNRRRPVTFEQVQEERIARVGGPRFVDLTVGAVLAHKEGRKTVEKRKWMGVTPVKCEMCHQPLKDFFTDGKTLMGPWALMCDSCERKHGMGHGTGLGQRYRLDTLEKVAG